MLLKDAFHAVALRGGSTFQEEDAEYRHITPPSGITAVEFPIRNATSSSGSSHG